MNLKSNYKKLGFRYFMTALLWLGCPLAYLIFYGDTWSNVTVSYLLILSLTILLVSFFIFSIFIKHYKVTISNVADTKTLFYKIGDFLQSKGFQRSTEIRDTYVKFIKEGKILPLKNKLFIHQSCHSITILGSRKTLLDIEQWYFESYAPKLIPPTMSL